MEGRQEAGGANEGGGVMARGRRGREEPYGLVGTGRVGFYYYTLLSAVGVTHSWVSVKWIPPAVLGEVV